MNREKTYIIVHPQSVEAAMLEPRTQSEAIRANNEIWRIRLDEDHRIVTHWNTIPTDLDTTREILVCGAYIHTCIQIVINELERAGFKPKLHPAGSI